MDLGGSKEPCIRCGQNPVGEGAIFSYFLEGGRLLA